MAMSLKLELLFQTCSFLFDPLFTFCGRVLGFRNAPFSTVVWLLKAMLTCQKNVISWRLSTWIRFQEFFLWKVVLFVVEKVWTFVAMRILLCLWWKTLSKLYMIWSTVILDINLLIHIVKINTISNNYFDSQYFSTLYSFWVHVRIVDLEFLRKSKRLVPIFLLTL